MQLATTHIATGLLVNGALVSFAAAMAGFFQRRQRWMQVQHYVMASVLAALALKLVFTERR